MRPRNLLIVLFVLSGCFAPKGYAHEPAPGERKRLIANELEGPLLEVHFLDVGQGDGIYVRTPGKKHYLIDVGTRSARKQIIPYLKYLGVEKLDGVIITHSHLDHMGALYYIAEAYPIDAVYSSGYFHSSGHNRKTLARLKEKKIPMKRLRAGDTLELDKKVTAAVYHPPKSWEGESMDPNNMSVVMRLSYDEIDFLLTGDAEKMSEKEILKAKYELKSEFLKVGHHGSKTSTSEAFLDTVAPIYAVISCGAGNKFNHPDKETVDVLRQRDITILRTDQNGTIGIYTNGKRVMIKIKGKNWEPVSALWPVAVPRNALLLITRGGIHAS